MHGAAVVWSRCSINSRSSIVTMQKSEYSDFIRTQIAVMSNTYYTSDIQRIKFGLTARRFLDRLLQTLPRLWHGRRRSVAPFIAKIHPVIMHSLLAQYHIIWRQRVSKSQKMCHLELQRKNNNSNRELAVEEYNGRRQ